MNKNELFFSVIICCYNSSKYIKSTINSIINQTYKKFELIIIDDGSSDNTIKLIESFLNDERIKLFKNTNNGMAYSRNFAVKKSNYEWIVILDHDDISMSNRLEKYYDFIVKNPSIDFLFSDMVYFNDKVSFLRFDKQYKKEKYKPYNLNLKKMFSFYNLLNFGCFIGSSSVAFRKSKYNSTSGFPLNYKFLSDYLFFLDLSKICDFYCFKEPLVKWRMHSNQSTEIYQNLYIYEMIKLYSKYLFDKNINYSLKFKFIFRILLLLIRMFTNKIKKIK